MRGEREGRATGRTLRVARAALLAACVTTAALAGAAPALAISAPSLTSPADGATVGSLPVFAWKAVGKADHYEFQLAADAKFNSPPLGHGLDNFFTKNTRATLKKTVPNGQLFWHVRAVSSAGAVSAWSATRSINKQWRIAPTLLSPVGGETLSFPSEPLRLSWSPVPRAAKYLVTLATDPRLGSIVGGAPVETQATSFTGRVGGSLAEGVYYWGVTPLDAQGNRGKASTVGWFRFEWPSSTTPAVRDLVPALEVFDPQFSWNPVPGAARYEVEVSSSDEFAAGSSVCCSGTTIATKLSSQVLFKDNVYYWRVRAIDVDGNAGLWNRGPDFKKTFDKVPPVVGSSIKNLRLRTDLFPDLEGLTPGYQTEVPIVSWDPVPGASSYQVDITPVAGTPPRCNATATTSHWRITTASTSWTPLGGTPPLNKPFDNARPISNDGFTQPIPGMTYCVRVRARSDRDSSNGDIYGDYAYVADGDQPSTSFAPSFTFTGYGTGDPTCSLPCEPGYLGSGDYIGPKGGIRMTSTPLFRWKPVQEFKSYFVLVAKDANFSNLIDYAFTRVPAYAPRLRGGPTTYPDETTLYYWAILPATGEKGEGAVGDPLQAAKQNFQKWSNPPQLLAPATDASILGQPTFRWTLTEGARRYRLQVSRDPSFGNPIDDIPTRSTSYTSDTTYEADTQLYWRVRAEDENLIALRWSPTGTFRKRLPVPVPSSTNEKIGTLVPTWSWAPITGAVSYNLQVDLPNSGPRLFQNLRSAAFTPVLLAGTGVFAWRVSANFPKDSFGYATGPVSPTQRFTRTLPEPASPSASVGTYSLAFGWKPVLGVKEYRLQVSRAQDFSSTVETVTTDNTSYAPQLNYGYQDGGRFYWRIGSVDELGNVGDYSDAQAIALPKAMRLSTNRYPVRNQRVYITITVRDVASNPVAGASVRASGAGVTAVTKTTGTAGSVTFRIRATKLGSVYFTASKSGYKTTTLALPVQ